MLLCHILQRGSSVHCNKHIPTPPTAPAHRKHGDATWQVPGELSTWGRAKPAKGREPKTLVEGGGMVLQAHCNFRSLHGG